PDAQGNLSLEGVNPWPVVQRAHQSQVKVLVSLAGGALKPEWVEAWDRLMRPGQRAAFIHRIMNYVRAYQLDGVDVDLEFRHVTAQYSGFVLQLRDSLQAEE
ncbi:glycosyl hydrolase family 18 protein, partial [Arthrospira platensis SPKY1]|nr:glycosyl hydrolase family 18 protein [Arthrospira platensis SPKY1]